MLVDPLTPAAAAGSFVDFYRSELSRQVRRASLLVGDTDTANDIVHDAFVNLYQRWDRVDTPGAYLNQSVLNGCRDLARRSSRWQRLAPKLTPVDVADPDVPLLDLLAGLPFNQRAVVVLRFYEAMTEAEIAAALDCPPGSVGPWLTRALATLRKELS